MKVSYHDCSDEVRRAMGFAGALAERLNYDEISPPMIFYGLLGIGTGKACIILQNLRVDLFEMQRTIEKRIPRLPNTGIVVGHLPCTSAGAEIFECARRESESLGHHYVATEHVLLALMQSKDEILCSVYEQFLIDEVSVRNALSRMSA